MSESLHELAREVLSGWARDHVLPSAVIDGCGPRLATFLGAETMTLPLDQFRHDAPEEGWAETWIHFPGHFEGAFNIYRPLSWSKLTSHGTDADLSEGDTIRQSILLRPIEAWERSIEGVVGGDVEGLYGAALLRPTYVHWVIVSGGGAEPWKTCSLFGAGDWVVEIRGEATDRATLERQLTSAMSSCPWRGWLEAARRTA